jgi:epoxyqueuosine reductase
MNNLLQNQHLEADSATSPWPAGRCYDPFVSLASEIKRCTLEAGFDLAGIAPLAAWHDLHFSRSWVEKGYGGQMHYLRNPKRADPRLILPSVKSMVCAGLVYNAPLPYSTEVVRTSCGASDAASNSAIQDSASDHGSGTTNAGRPREARGWISRYAWGRDYHELTRARLEELRTAIEGLAPGVETRAYVDTGPVVERAFARLSGIGWMGKNTCLINQEKGSWFFLGVILTSLELEPDQPAFDRCGSCTRCLIACPTGALVEPYVMDASRCIAYFNIELKGSIPAEFRPAIGANLFGCDICQDVCPWNARPWSVAAGPALDSGDHRRQAATTHLPEFQPMAVGLPQAAAPQAAAESQQTANLETRTPGRTPNSASGFLLFHPRLEDLTSLSEEDFRRAFSHSPIKRVKYLGWLRSLCVVIGNSGDARFVPWLEKLRHHTDAVVREHAEWALERLRSGEQAATH